jgi:xanthine dehydrogenase accessory factor
MIDLEALAAAIATHGPVARVVIAAQDGSSPREAGAAMLVWAQGQSGTIGGGALEWEAAARARAMLTQGGDGKHLPLHTGGRGGDNPALASRIDRVPLGPALGQCCGGAVTLVTEVFDAVPLPVAGLVARSVETRDMPLAVRRMIDRARGQGVTPGITLAQGWLVEPVARVQRRVWVWGAGHVGRALVAVLVPLPGVAVTWVDVAADRFPPDIPAGVTALPCAAPEALAAHAPMDAEHLILTYSHALDLELCHRLLGHGFARAGLIGSATKWARFRSRLAALGHAPQAVARIRCPIGDPGLGKHPQAIAIGVAAEFLGAGQAALRQEGTG